MGDARDAISNMLVINAFIKMQRFNETMRIDDSADVKDVEVHISALSVSTKLNSLKRVRDIHQIVKGVLAENILITSLNQSLWRWCVHTECLFSAVSDNEMNVGLQSTETRADVECYNLELFNCGGDGSGAGLIQ